MEALISLAGSHAVEVQVTAVITSDNIGKLLAEDELETGWLTNNEHPFISWELIESNKYRGCDSTHKHPSSLLIIFCGAEAAPQNFSLQLCHISWVSILYTFAVQAVVWGPVASASPGSLLQMYSLRLLLYQNMHFNKIPRYLLHIENRSLIHFPSLPSPFLYYAYISTTWKNPSFPARWSRVVSPARLPLVG